MKDMARLLEKWQLNRKGTDVSSANTTGAGALAWPINRGDFAVPPALNQQDQLKSAVLNRERRESTGTGK